MSEHKRRYDRRRAAGRCVRCPNRAVTGKALCASCSDRQLALKREKRGSSDPLPILKTPWQPPKQNTGLPHKRTTAGDARQALGYCPPAGSVALAFFGRVVSHWHR